MPGDGANVPVQPETEESTYEDPTSLASSRSPPPRAGQATTLIPTLLPRPATDQAARGVRRPFLPALGPGRRRAKPAECSPRAVLRRPGAGAHHRHGAPLQRSVLEADLARASGGACSLLAHGVVARVSLAVLACNLCIAMLEPLVPRLLSERPFSMDAADVGFVWSASTLGYLAGTPLAGWLSDAEGRAAAAPGARPARSVVRKWHLICSGMPMAALSLLRCACARSLK